MFSDKPRCEWSWYGCVFIWLSYIIYMVVDICLFINRVVSSNNIFHVFWLIHILWSNVNLYHNAWHQRPCITFFSKHHVIVKVLWFIFLVIKGLLYFCNKIFSRSSYWASCYVMTPCILGNDDRVPLMLCIFSVLPYAGFGMSIATCGQMFLHVFMKQKVGIKGS